MVSDRQLHSDKRFTNDPPLSALWRGQRADGRGPYSSGETRSKLDRELVRIPLHPPEVCRKESNPGILGLFLNRVTNITTQLGLICNLLLLYSLHRS